MLRKLRVVVELVLCAAILLLAWQNGQLRSQNAELNGRILGAGNDRAETTAQPVNEHEQLGVSEDQKRELMRLRAEVTRLRNIPADSATKFNVSAKPEEQLPAQKSEGLFPGVQSEPGGSDSDSPTATPTVVTWNKLKIDQTGSITLNDKPRTPEEFTAECERIKAGYGGFVLFIEGTSGVLNPAQIQAMQQITKAQIPVRAVTTEKEL